MNIMKLFSSEAVKNMALGTLKKAMRENKIETATIHYNSVDDEIDFKFHENPVAVIPASELQNYKDAINSLLIQNNTP